MNIRKVAFLGLFLMHAAFAEDDLEIKRLYEEKNYKELFARFRIIAEGRATNAGYSLGELASTKYNLGLMYQQGLGVPKDSQKAMLWYTKAAMGGAPRAQYNLGLIYYEGEGTEKDLKLAIQWLEKSAAQGYADAEVQLGYMYDSGEGDAQDHAIANAWRQQAALHRK